MRIEGENDSDNSMLQAEVGGGARVDPNLGLQRPGYLIRDFILNSGQGKPVQISDYRGRANLVLVFCGAQHNECDFLRNITRRVGHSRSRKQS